MNLFLCVIIALFVTDRLFFSDRTNLGFLSEPQTGRVRSVVAQLSTEPTATVAWQLSRAPGEAKWTDTHEKKKRKKIRGDVGLWPKYTRRSKGPGAWTGG